MNNLSAENLLKHIRRAEKKKMHTILDPLQTGFPSIHKFYGDLFCDFRLFPFSSLLYIFFFIFSKVCYLNLYWRLLKCALLFNVLTRTAVAINKRSE